MAMADGVEDATVHMQARKYNQKKKQKIAYYITIEREKDLKNSQVVAYKSSTLEAEARGAIGQVYQSLS